MTPPPHQVIVRKGTAGSRGRERNDVKRLPPVFASGGSLRDGHTATAGGGKEAEKELYKKCVFQLAQIPGLVSFHKLNDRSLPPSQMMQSTLAFPTRRSQFNSLISFCHSFFFHPLLVHLLNTILTPAADHLHHGNYLHILPENKDNQVQEVVQVPRHTTSAVLSSIIY
jgi:hypothetical protein